jgi:hypothetical protein
MILSIHQPSYFPWLGLLDKIAKSDVYMVMDEVQLSDSAFQNRNIFLSPDGKTKYLTIGFNKINYFSRRFCDLEIVQTDWQEKHLNTLKAYYGKHRFYAEVLPFIEPVFSNAYTLLVDPVVESMRISMQLLEIPTRVINQHELDYDRATRKNDLVLTLVQAAEADVYLAGTGSKAYMQLETFTACGIQVRFNHFAHPEYQQRNMQKFEPGISCLDLLFNEGIERSREIFWQAVRGEVKHG